MTVVLDQGLAAELQARAHDLSDRLWSARVLAEDPDAIERFGTGTEHIAALRRVPDA